MPAVLRKYHLARLLAEQRYDILCRDLGMENLNLALRLLTERGIGRQGLRLCVGGGSPRRRFLWVEDMADAFLPILSTINFSALNLGLCEIRNTHINIGYGSELPN